MVIVSAMGSHPTSPVKVTDLLLNMISKAAARDDAYLQEIEALQEKHIATAQKLLDNGTEQGKKELTVFTAQLTKDIDGIKSILNAIMAGLLSSLPLHAYPALCKLHVTFIGAFRHRLCSSSARIALCTVSAPSRSALNELADSLRRYPANQATLKCLRDCIPSFSVCSHTWSHEKHR
jgi:hypothetical protein